MFMTWCWPFWCVLLGSGCRYYRWSKCLAHVPVCSLGFLDKQLLGHGGVEKSEGWGALLSYRGGLEHDGTAQQMRPPASRRQAKGAKRRLPVEGGCFTFVFLHIMYAILSQLLCLWETCLGVFSSVAVSVRNLFRSLQLSYCVCEKLV